MMKRKPLHLGTSGPLTQHGPDGPKDSPPVHTGAPYLIQADPA